MNARRRATQNDDAMQTDSPGPGFSLTESAELVQYQHRQFLDQEWADFLRREQLGFDSLKEEDYISFMNFVDEALHQGLRQAGAQ